MTLSAMLIAKGPIWIGGEKR